MPFSPPDAPEFLYVLTSLMTEGNVCMCPSERGPMRMADKEVNSCRVYLSSGTSSIYLSLHVYCRIYTRTYNHLQGLHSVTITQILLVDKIRDCFTPLERLIRVHKVRVPAPNRRNVHLCQLLFALHTLKSSVLTAYPSCLKTRVSPSRD